MATDTKKMEQMLGSSVPFQKSEEDGIPVYFQLAKRIQQQIEKGRFAAGELIPSERKIASHNNLSLATVRKALEELVHKGFLKRVQGKGTYVAGTADRLKTIRYYTLAKGFNDDQAQLNSKFIEIKKIKGRPQINQQLKIGGNKGLYMLRRIISHIDEPIIYCVSYLPRKLFKGLDTCEQAVFEIEPLYLFLEKKFGITTTKHIELLGASPSDKETAKLLNIKIGKPLLRIDKIVFTHKDKPYEYRESYCLTSEHKLRRVI